MFVFIHGLTGRVFKILPLKEEMDGGADVHLAEYVESLARDVIGSLITFPELAEMPEYLTVVNTLQFLNMRQVDKAICKREVFKMLKILNQIEERLGGDANV